MQSTSTEAPCKQSSRQRMRIITSSPLRENAAVCKDLKRHMKNIPTEGPFYTYIRIRANRYLTHKIKVDKKRPKTSFSNNSLYLEPSTNNSLPSVYDLYSSTSTSKTQPLHFSTSKSHSKSPQPDALVNTWMPSDPGREAWLVMRGRNIQLRHQDYVKNVLTCSRQASLLLSSRRSPSVESSLSTKLNFRHECTIPITKLKSPTQHPQIRARSHGYGYQRSSNQPNSSQFFSTFSIDDVRPSSRDIGRTLQRPATTASDAIKSLVIKIPLATETK